MFFFDFCLMFLPLILYLLIKEYLLLAVLYHIYGYFNFNFTMIL